MSARKMEKQRTIVHEYRDGKILAKVSINSCEARIAWSWKNFSGLFFLDHYSIEETLSFIKSEIKRVKG